MSWRLTCKLMLAKELKLFCFPLMYGPGRADMGNGYQNFVLEGEQVVRTTKMAVLTCAALALALAIPASADTVTFNLTGNNLGINQTIGTVTITDAGANTVDVSIQMNAGFSIKLNGGDVGFNGVSGLTLGSVSNLTADSNTGLSFDHLKTTQNVSQFGTFAFDFTNIKGQPGGVVSADTLTFTLTAAGLSANQFTGVVIHFCTASGSNCGPQTGFASNGPPSEIPEPGTLGLLGTGLVGLAGLLRRRFM